MQAAIQTSSLHKQYGRQVVLRDLSLLVPRGSIFGLLGPNGAGKTTALRVIAGLARPTGGRALILDRDVRAPRARRDLGVLIDAPAFYPNLTARENLRVHRRDAHASNGRVQEVLAEVDLLHAADRPAGQYSLGMKQRLGIAIALLGRPEVLILDEPQNGLDPQGTREMRDLLLRLHAAGHTLLVSSHLLHEVQQVATHVGVITAGRLAFQGTMSELLARTAGRVWVEVDDPQRALGVLSGHAELTREGLLVRDLAAGEIARRLVTRGLELRRLEPEVRSLEQHFFEMTGNANGRVSA